MSFVITNTGIAAAVTAAGGGPGIVLATFKLGTGVNYTPLATQTDIQGTLLYSGPITAVQPYDANTVSCLIQIPANAGPFSFGEIAIFNSAGVMFACHAFPQLQYKAAGLSSGVGSVWGISCLLRLTQANTVFTISSGTAPVDSPNFTGSPTAPTPPVDNNSTRIATTVWYHGQRGTATPLINGTAAAGTALRWAPQDHVHPTDSTRAPILSPAFTGTPTAVTPPTTDSSTRLATTSFVTQLGVRYPGHGGAITANRVMLVSEVGKWFELQVAAISVSLPSVATTLAGQSFTFMVSVGDCVLSAFGTEIIQAPGYGANIYQLQAGETITVVSNGPGGAWYITIGGYGKRTFANLLAINGWQELPGGLILQWGQTANLDAQQSTRITFPRAFRFQLYSCTATPQQPGNYDVFAEVGIDGDVNGITIHSARTGNDHSAAPVNWFAIGV